jgi:HSP20 family protein
MNLVRWNPFSDFATLQNQMNRLFDSSLYGWSGESSTRTWMPPADIHETDDELVVTADLPGIDLKSVDLRVESNVLSIAGERKLQEPPKKGTVHRVERMYGGFARSFTLSTPVETEKIQAKYKDGVLTITLPKAQEAKPRRIAIAAAAAA